MVKSVEEIIQVLQSQANYKHIEIKLKQNCPEIKLKLDVMRITQVLINLLSNAIKFSKSHSSIQVSVRYDIIDADMSNVTISVKDTGIGIND